MSPFTFCSLAQAEMEVIYQSLSELQQVLCIPIQVWPLNTQASGDYVFYQRGYDGSGCYSAVGKQGTI